MGDKTKHLVRVGHEFAAAMSDDTPIITIAKMVTELASALDVQTARADALAAELKQSQIDAACYKHGMEQSNQRLNELAAENAGMDAFVEALLSIAWQGGSADGAEIQELAQKHGLLRQEIYCADEHENLVDDPGNFEDGDPVYFRVKTPATDAFNRELQAQGVEAGIERVITMINHQSTGVSASINVLRTFAAQLRGNSDGGAL